MNWFLSINICNKKVFKATSNKKYVATFNFFNKDIKICFKVKKKKI